MARAPRYRRERWESPDGDFVDVDFLDHPSQAPMLVLFHGLEGNSASHYSVAIARETARRGWRFAVPHFRGCSGEMNRLPRAYHSGDSGEIAWLLTRFRAAAGAAPLYAIGISLGGNALLKWLGESGDHARAIVTAAAAICAPLDVRLSGDALGVGFNRLYTSLFLATMKSKSAAKLARHAGIFDGAAMLRSRTLREFDNVVTAPLHGFRDTDDYWERASARPLLTSIGVPTLLINALDDPFVPNAALPDVHALPACVSTDFPSHGGHVGFISGAFPGTFEWLPKRVCDYFENHCQRGMDG